MERKNKKRVLSYIEKRRKNQTRKKNRRRVRLLKRDLR